MIVNNIENNIDDTPCNNIIIIKLRIISPEFWHGLLFVVFSRASEKSVTIFRKRKLYERLTKDENSKSDPNHEGQPYI